MGGGHKSRQITRFRLNSRTKKGVFMLGFIGTILVGMIGLVALVAVVYASPQAGAEGADFLRNILGNKPVADLEGVVFTVQDDIHQLLYKLGRATPSAPWAIDVSQAGGKANSSGSASKVTQNPSGTSKPGAYNAPSKISSNRLQSGNQTAATNHPVTTQWKIENILSLGNIPGEGVWSAYIVDPSGQVVAYRTFLQPDPQRPYVTVAIAAFDLIHTQLHYQLGLIEPVAPNGPPRTGEIPSADRQPGILIAAFNGGFKTVHGHYGVMIDGQELIPMINQMGTIAIYQDGSIRIGEWGTDITATADMVVARQNCPLMVHNGVINPLVYNNSVNDWGGTLSGGIVTFRSGIGISQDGKTLYYFAGNYLTMPVLAKAMQDAGAYQAMQLDINNYWVHFTKFELVNNQLQGIPLLPKEMIDNIDRYLYPYARDFFYVTASNP